MSMRGSIQCLKMGFQYELSNRAYNKVPLNTWSLEMPLLVEEVPRFFPATCSIFSSSSAWSEIPAEASSSSSEHRSLCLILNAVAMFMPRAFEIVFQGIAYDRHLYQLIPGFGALVGIACDPRVDCSTFWATLEQESLASARQVHLLSCRPYLLPPDDSLLHQM